MRIPFHPTKTEKPLDLDGRTPCGSWRICNFSSFWMIASPGDGYMRQIRSGATAVFGAEKPLLTFEAPQHIIDIASL